MLRQLVILNVILLAAFGLDELSPPETARSKMD
jgi:hypothetical protein